MIIPNYTLQKTAATEASSVSSGGPLDQTKEEVPKGDASSHNQSGIDRPFGSVDNSELLDDVDVIPEKPKPKKVPRKLRKKPLTGRYIRIGRAIHMLKNLENKPPKRSCTSTTVKKSGDHLQMNRTSNKPKAVVSCGEEHVVKSITPDSAVVTQHNFRKVWKEEIRKMKEDISNGGMTAVEKKILRADFQKEWRKATGNQKVNTRRDHPSD